ncbi:ABC transporter substrate-binding protein [Niveibacterium umoris]|uniref:Polar amino acid transport system substrate-binding protein n=1 Tax=Niveibacterium umoris TaxID=1193620 RepID=A0A840BI70_9RHOO|nr:transporter substrate-binding domain-containing protein [Niveibacterium umoris]MBB4012014.1 polar amino acid transport system substrate-binding protein [Niveibacterium umoris]
MKFLITALVLVLLMKPASAAERLIVAGDDSNPPYSWVENGSFKGIYVDIVAAVARAIGDEYKLDIQPVPWKRGLAMLQAGEAFALFPPYRRAERAFITAYSEPLFRERVVVTCTAAAAQHPRKKFPDDFRDVQIGINAGYALADVVVKARRDELLQVEEANGTMTNLRKIAMNRIDCFINDRASTQFAFKELRNAPDATAAARQLELVDTVEISSEDAFIALGPAGTPAKRKAVLNRINAAIKTLRSSGEIERIVERYLTK